MRNSNFPGQTFAWKEITQINDYLYLSGARAVRAEAIIDREITCIINATVETFNVYVENLEYVRVSADDTPSEDLSQHFDTVADKIFRIKLNGGKTLVHCINGVSRSPALCIAYLMKHERMRLLDAYCYVKGRRPIVHPNCGFFKQLIEYEKKLFDDAESVQWVTTPNGISMPDVYEKEYDILTRWTSNEANEEETL